MLGKLLIGMVWDDPHKGEGDQGEQDGASGEQDEEVVCAAGEDLGDGCEEQGTETECGEGERCCCSSGFGIIQGSSFDRRR